MKSYEIINADVFNYLWEISCDGAIAVSNNSKQYVLDTWNQTKAVHVELNITQNEIPIFYQEKIENDGLKLGFILEWYCPKSSFRGRVGNIVEAYFDKHVHLVLVGDIGGENLAGNLIITCNLVVIKSDSKGYFSKGLIVCHGNEIEIALEGDRAQFPVQIVSFRDDPNLKKFQNSLFVLDRNLEAMELSDIFSSSYMLNLNDASECTKILNGSTSVDSSNGFVVEGMMRLLMFEVYKEILCDISEYAKRSASLDEFLKELENNKKDITSVGAVYYFLLSNVSIQASLPKEVILNRSRSTDVNDVNLINQALQNLVSFRGIL